MVFATVPIIIRAHDLLDDCAVTLIKKDVCGNWTGTNTKKDNSMKNEGMSGAAPLFAYSPHFAFLFPIYSV